LYIAYAIGTGTHTFIALKRHLRFFAVTKEHFAVLQFSLFLLPFRIYPVSKVFFSCRIIRPLFTIAPTDSDWCFLPQKLEEAGGCGLVARGRETPALSSVI
jgi:hypothetical protein